MCAMALCVVFLCGLLTDWKDNLQVLAEQNYSLTFSLTQQEEAICYRYQDKQIVISVSGENDFYISSSGEMSGSVVPIALFFEEELGMHISIWDSVSQTLYNVNENAGTTSTTAGTTDAAKDAVPEAQIYYERYTDQLLQQNAGSKVLFQGSSQNVYMIYTESNEYKPLLEIFDRYANRTQEGEVLVSHMEAQEEQCKTMKFTDENADELKQIKEAFSVIAWSSISEYDTPLYYRYDGTRKGLVLPLLDYLERMTGIPCVDVTDEVQEDPVTALEENKIQLLIGVADTEETEGLAFLSMLYQNEMVFLVPDESELTSFEEAKYLYWGIENSLIPLIKIEDLEDRIVNFNSTSEMVKALNEDEIGGILIPKGQAELWELEGVKYRVVSEEPVIVPEYLAGNTKNEALNQMIERLILQYNAEYPDAYKESGLPENKNETFWQESYIWILALPEWSIIGCCSIMILLLILWKVYGNRNKNCSRDSRSHKGR